MRLEFFNWNIIEDVLDAILPAIYLELVLRVVMDTDVMAAAMRSDAQIRPQSNAAAGCDPVPGGVNHAEEQFCAAASTLAIR